jgi:hypothetical protein
MKSLLIFYISLLCCNICNAQFIEFEDPNFKNILLQASVENEIASNIVIDTNGNGEIDISETEQVGILRIPSNSGVFSLGGIEHFSNLLQLYCHNNLLTTLDVSMLTNLTNLGVNNNLLETLEINPQMRSLSFENNYVETLNLTGISSLIGVYCRNNNLIELDLSGQQDLFALYCNDNQLSFLNVQNTRLFHLHCNDNQLTELDLTGVGADFSDPTTTSLDINCSNNLLTTLDTTVTSFAQVSLDCSNNPDLESLYLKNGIAFEVGTTEEQTADIFIENNFNLQFICADDFNLDYVQGKLDAEGITDCLVTSNCELGIADITEDIFKLYPNPIQDKLTINCPSRFNSLFVYNMLGQKIYNTKFESNVPIELNFLSSGTYVAQIRSNDDRYEFIVVKD